MKSLLLYSVFLFSLFNDSNTSHLPEDFLAWNQPFSNETCLDKSGYMLVHSENESQCLRYYPSSSLTGEKTVVIQLYGDRDLSSKMAINEIKNNTQTEQEKLAAAKHQKIKNVPWVILARPGTYGSSGNHKDKRMLSEFLAINNALDGLKGRYDIKRFIVVGHSGGATLGAGLLTLGRADIQCAILSSGTYDYLARRALTKLEQNSVSYDSKTRSILKQYDPYFYTENIVQDPSRKIFILGDSRDKNTPFHLQLAFAYKVEHAGHLVNIVEFVADGPDYHNIKENDFMSLLQDCL